uniref:BTB domain-containing protein n=1 Tax=Panagrellus redivivus TaxID=6233 RepID=A0A7E4VQ15_PANRE
MTNPLEDTVILKVANTTKVESELRDVPGASWLKWSLQVYPARRSNKIGSIEVYLRVVGGDATVKATIVCDFGTYQRKTTRTLNEEFTDGDVYGFNNFCKNTFFYINYIHTFTCTAVFKPKSVLTGLTIHELIDESKAHCLDAKIVIGTEEIKVHRGFLSMISPVFTAMFKPETQESQTGVVNITDFSFSTVKNALEYCYGVDLNVGTVAEVVSMLRFYDKYDIQPAVVKLEAWLKANLTVKNFAPIAAYAWRHSRESLQADCGRMFYEKADIVKQLEFAALDPTVIAGVVKAGYTSTGKTIPEANSGLSRLDHPNTLT